MIGYLIGLPLLGSVILLLGGRRTDKWGHLLATALSGSSFLLGLKLFMDMLGLPTEERAMHQKLFTWINVGTFQVDAGLLLDQLSICFVLLITGVGTLIHIYSIAYMSHDLDRRRFFAYLNLFRGYQRGGSTSFYRSANCHRNHVANCCDWKVCTVPIASLARGCDGRSNASICIDSRGNNGYRRRLSNY